MFCSDQKPKDTVASYYPFCKAAIGSKNSEDQKIQDWLANITFRDFIRMFLWNDNQSYGRYFSYIEYMWELAKDNPNTLIIYYEDLKEASIAACCYVGFRIKRKVLEIEIKS